MNEFSKYDKMREDGLSPQEVYLTAKSDGLNPIALIAMLRSVFQLSLIEAKEVTVTADGTAVSLKEQQAKLIPGLEKALEEIDTCNLERVD